MHLKDYEASELVFVQKSIAKSGMSTTYKVLLSPLDSVKVYNVTNYVAEALGELLTKDGTIRVSGYGFCHAEHITSALNLALGTAFRYNTTVL